MKDREERIKDLKYRLVLTNTLATKILRDIINKDPEYGNDPDKLFEHLEFVVNEMYITHSIIVQMHNKQIADGIRGLKEGNEWPNLNKVSTHALSTIKEMLEGGDNPFAVVLESVKLELEFGELSIAAKRKAIAALG